MNTDNVTCTRKRSRRRPASIGRAFTLVELLVVISIIAVVAGLVVGLTRTASERKKVTRAQAELNRLVTLIENYRARLGVLPPDNPDKNSPHLNTLFYELASAVRMNPNSGNPTYTTRLRVDVRSNVLYETFGVSGLINARDANADITELKPILKDVRPDQTNSIVPGTISLTVPMEGPFGKDRPNPWQYRVGENALHNKESFDLWVDIIIGKKTNTIGNWKD